MSRESRARARRTPTGRNVSIGYVRPSHVDGRWADCVMSLIEYERERGGNYKNRIIGETGPRIARARNDVVEQFLSSPDTADCEWLLWLDTDMTFDANLLENLLACADPVERPIVGGLCFAGGRSHITPTLYVFNFRTAEDGSMHVDSDLPLYYPDNELIDVGGTGCACVLVHRSVFEAIRAKFSGKPEIGPMIWYQDLVLDGRDFGEDLIFCLRALLCEKQTFVHTGIKVGHRKMTTLGEDQFREYCKRVEAQFGDGEMPERLTANQLNELMGAGAVP